MFKKYADEAMELVKLIEADGARLPGTEEEKAACKKLQGEIVKRTGLTPYTEKFTYAPNASIGAINKLGWVALLMFLVYYIGGIGGTIIAMLGCFGLLIFTLTQIVRYTGMWDFAFKQATAENIVTELEPAKGETEYTVYLGAHYDSSWCWKLAARNPTTALIKTGYGIIGVIVLMILSILRLCLYSGAFDDYTAWNISLYVIPLAFLPGYFFLTQYLTQDKTVGSPGAMDNLSGIALNMMIVKYFKEHPEDMPEGMKLVNIGFASEEAGLKGSFAYVKAHKNEIDVNNSYVFNVDSVADPGHFEAVKGDPWQGTKFDKKLIDMTCEAIKESGEEPHTIVNPVGGCDSTPFCKIGVPTTTFAAQNPVSTEYYHTYKDVSDRIDVSTFETGLNVIYKVIKKIDAQRALVPEVAVTEVITPETATEETTVEAAVTAEAPATGTEA